jgi:hypothetical protein
VEEVNLTVTEASDRISPLLASLAAEDASDREEASETVVDWLSTITRGEASRLATGLTSAVISERSSIAREAELNALAELASHGLLTRDDVLPIAELGRPAPGVTGREHLVYLDEEFSLWP